MRPLHEWPADSLLLIADQISDAPDLNALARTSWQMYNLLNPYLYRRSIRTRGNTAIIQWAIQEGMVNTARHCLQAGANPNLPMDDQLGKLALHVALEERRRQQGTHRFRRTAGEVVAEILERYRSLVLLFLDGGADIHGRTRQGWTPLHTAASLPDLEMARLLVSRGADVTLRDEFDATPLHLAAFSGDEGVVGFLLEKGSDVNAVKGGWGATPLHQAAAQGTDEVVILLLAHGADVMARNRRQATPLHHAASAAKSVEVIQLLIDAGADLEAVDGKGLTPLQRAIGKPLGRQDWDAQLDAVVECLLEKGANVEVLDREMRDWIDANPEMVDCLWQRSERVEVVETRSGKP